MEKTLKTSDVRHRSFSIHLKVINEDARHGVVRGGQGNDWGVQGEGEPSRQGATVLFRRADSRFKGRDPRDLTIIQGQGHPGVKRNEVNNSNTDEVFSLQIC